MSSETQQSSGNAIEQAARWLLVTPRREISGPIVVAVRERYGISIKDAIEAMRLSDRIRRGPQ
jgi:hypothetical protein